MVDLQELIVRGRMIFDGASRRLQVFELVNGFRSTKDVAKKTGRSLVAVNNDLGKLNDFELVREKTDFKGNVVKKGASRVYEKTPLAKHVPLSYFKGSGKTGQLVRKKPTQRGKTPRQGRIYIPSDKEVLDICRLGEDQVYEFKAPGVSADKITKEVAGFLHTKGGGIIFYGVDDDGGIIGADMKRQTFDQKVQNSVRNTISPSPGVEIRERRVMGASVLLVVVHPWDRKTIYQNTLDGRYYVRRGTNIFAVKPDELRKLHQGEFIA